MTNDKPDMAGEFYQAAITRLENERGVHAETAVAALARMAGTFLFRSFGLPTGNLAPGTAVLSEIANVKGPVLVETLTGFLNRKQVQRRTERGASEPGEPQLSLLQTQALLEPEFDAIRRKHNLTFEETAHLLMIATGGLIAKCANVLDPEVAFSIAVKALVESTKTVPQRFDAPAVESAAGTWLERIKSLFGR